MHSEPWHALLITLSPQQIQMPENSRETETWGFTEDESKLWPSTYTVSATFTGAAGQAASTTHRPPLSPRIYHWYSFLLEAGSTPGPQGSRKDYTNEKFQCHHRESNPRPSCLYRSASVRSQRVSCISCSDAIWHSLWSTCVATRNTNGVQKKVSFISARQLTLTTQHVK